jgi:two-component system alkaline phosphatase synthesis response regulator PhoP
MKVVLVDDNPDLGPIMAAVGRYENVEVITFESSLDALKYLDENEADAVILDLELPVIDGLRLAKEIRKNEEIHSERTPVKMVFYSAKEYDETIERVGEKVGVDKRYMIKKPYSLTDLVGELKRDFIAGP